MTIDEIPLFRSRQSVPDGSAHWNVSVAQMEEQSADYQELLGRCSLEQSFESG